ncbi:MAG: TetR/AcrR family transcriptional regulator [Acidimicrobiales bacterium]|nr:TetR/AcrR family transcriptional regulator [Acidimicrobiales bacterium]
MSQYKSKRSVLGITENDYETTLAEGENQPLKRTGRLDAVVEAVMDTVADTVSDVTDVVTGAVRTRLSVPSGSKDRHSDRTSKREGRRQELLDAAVDAIRNEGANTSMEAIASAAGVTKPILYRHFEDRAGLVNALAKRSEEMLFDALNEALGLSPNEVATKDPRRLLRTTIETYVTFIDENRDVYHFLTRHQEATPPGFADFMQRVARQVSVVLDLQLHSYGLDTGPAELWAHAIVGMVHQAGDWWSEHQVMTRSRMVDALCRLLWSGFEGIAIAGGVPIPDEGELEPHSELTLVETGGKNLDNSENFSTFKANNVKEANQ